MNYGYYIRRYNELDKEQKVDRIRLMFLNQIINDISCLAANSVSTRTIDKTEIRDLIHSGVSQMNELVKEQYEINARIA